jgi:hypothetical protein
VHAKRADCQRLPAESLTIDPLLTNLLGGAD